MEISEPWRMFSARIVDHGITEITGATGKHHFLKIAAGFELPSNNPGYFCVVGERIDGIYHVFHEYQGRLSESARCLRQCAHAWHLDFIATTKTDEATHRLLVDALSLEPPPRLFPHAGQADDIGLITIPESATRSIGSILDGIREMMSTGALVVHPKTCSALLHSIHRPWADLMVSPVMRALCWVIMIFERTRDFEHILQSEPWYGNRQ